MISYTANDLVLSSNSSLGVAKALMTRVLSLVRSSASVVMSATIEAITGPSMTVFETVQDKQKREREGERCRHAEEQTLGVITQYQIEY